MEMSSVCAANMVALDYQAFERRLVKLRNCIFKFSIILIKLK